MKTLLFWSVILIINQNSFGQFNPTRFGKADINVVKSNVCPNDENAEAYIVFDDGETFFTYERGWRYETTRHVMVKIINQSGYGFAEFEIPYYKTGTREEKITSLRGFTYNDENGKVKKVKLGGDQIFREEITSNLHRVKVTFPNVKEGSVVELKYTISSDFFEYLRNWQFQYQIPVLQSRYRIGTPEYFRYQSFMKGYEPLHSNTSSVRPQNDPNSGLEYNVNQHEYVAINLPALKNESYVNAIQNYRNVIEFELRAIQIPGVFNREYTTSWEKVTERFLEMENFGKRLEGGSFWKDEISEITAGNTDPEEIMKAVHQKVVSMLKWNGVNSPYARNPLRRVYRDGIGNSTEINFVLLSMLRAANIEAYPVLLSTRSNGMIVPFFPTMDKFNYTIVKAMVNGKIRLLDATDPHCPPGVLPVKCLNGQGRIIDPQRGGWVDLYAAAPYEEVINYELTLNDEGNFKGTRNIQQSGYAAYSTRQKLERAVTTEKFIENYMNDNQGMEVESFNFSGIDSFNMLLSCEMNVKINNHNMIMGDMLSFMPVFYERTEENPFRLGNRKFPVDFAYPVNKKVLVRIKIPDGYTIESLPESVNLVLPDNGGNFVFQAAGFDNLIHVTTLLNHNKAVYLPDEYANLQELYTRMVAKQAEQVILKKKTL